ncbi:MAG: PilZ domain-containing protein [Desulfobulbaceae bacterium]|nr:PilZ domain-containing protein [Desulfobulbaceae bacterium]
MIELDQGNRRQSVRLDFVSDVIVRSAKGDKIIKGELINLSIGGMSLRTPVLLDNGLQCIVAILIKDRYSQLVIKDVEGVVVRSSDGEIGIKFKHHFEWLALFHVYYSKSSETD